MKKRYNLNTKKIYESAEQYVLNVEEFDANGKLINNVEFEDRYPNAKVAIEDAYDIMTNVADDQNIDQDDVEFDERDNKVIFTVEGVGKWVFTATVDATNECGDNCNHDDMDECNECGDVMESKNFSGKRFGRIYENTTQNKKYVFYFDISGSMYKDVNTLVDKFSEISNNINSNYVDVHLFNTRIESSWYDENVSNVFQILQDVDLFGGSNIKCVYNNIIKNYGYNPDCEFFILTDQDFMLQSQDIIDFHKSNPNVNIKYIIECNGVKYNDIEEYLDRMGINYEILDDKNTSKVSSTVRKFLENKENVGESVSARFARLRKMFESDDESDDNQDNNTDDDSTDDVNIDDDNNNDNEDDEEMKAVILTVKKGDAQKCKDELIDAGIPEEDIEIIRGDVTEGEDDESDNDEIRVDVNSVMELKDYLATKGIDLEEEIGGEIVSDDDETSDDNKDEEDGKGEDEEDFNFDDLGDIFGAEEEDK